MIAPKEGGTYTLVNTATIRETGQKATAKADFKVRPVPGLPPNGAAGPAALEVTGAPVWGLGVLVAAVAALAVRRRKH